MNCVNQWTAQNPPNPARNAFVSLALRPAPITDQWLDEGPALTSLADAMQGVTLVEAASQRAEALAIAMRLRKAAEDGVVAALVSPDRNLTRRVSATLDRWDIAPDDSAGIPLHLSPPGRFLRHVCDQLFKPAAPEAMLALLKHPITHSGADRGKHLLLTREFELFLRSQNFPNPAANEIRTWASAQKDSFADAWANWLCDNLFTNHETAARPLVSYVEDHETYARRIAAGSSNGDADLLWSQSAGQEVMRSFDELKREAIFGGLFNPAEYIDLFGAIMSRGEVRDPEASHPLIRIWGTLEARVQGADLVILAGLNEGSWPEAPKPDPWLNRSLRAQAGLLLPERNIGLSAHDFMQAVLAKEVWLTRSIRSDDAETVVSRWLNRIKNLLQGLSDNGGPSILEEMHERGKVWLRRAEALERAVPSAPSPRPSPCPPVKTRPRHLSVTEVKRLIRDPYSIYCKHILGLRALNPLVKEPDALVRGIVFHEILERFVHATAANDEYCTKPNFLKMADAILNAQIPWLHTRIIWKARLERFADWFIESELARRTLAKPAAFEVKGRASLPNINFVLSAKADRIDVDASGTMHIYDYKTGLAPSKPEQEFFDKQLLLETAIAEEAGFEGIPPHTVKRAIYIELGRGGREVFAPIDEHPPAKVWDELSQLIRAYQNPNLGYTSRRAMQHKDDAGDFDQLARFGEWDIADSPIKTWPT